jgi:peptidoglycan/LPS O-acetylase OafA/YrhL
MLFFMLSSFLMFYLYYSVKPYSLKKLGPYIYNRLTRVMPLFWLVTLFSFIFVSNGWLVGLGVDKSNIVGVFFLINGPSILWTIPCEVIFYLIFALILLCGNVGRAIFLIVAVGLMLSFSVIFDVHRIFENPPIWLAKWYVIRTFIFGAIAYYVVQLGFIPRNISFTTSAVFGLIIAVLFLLNFPQIHLKLTGEGLRMWGWREFETQLICATLLVCAISLPAVRWFFEANPLAFLGRISYSLYLTHPFALQVLQKNGLVTGDVPVFLGAMAWCIAIATVSFFLVEKPLQRVLRGWAVGTVFSRVSRKEAEVI